MILYVDTSSLVKVFVPEQGYQETRALVSHAQRVATSVVTYVEMWSALSRKLRNGESRPSEYQRYLDQFETYWPLISAVPLDGDLTHIAARLAQRPGLRALDAIHLATAVYLTQRVDEPLMFSCADTTLRTAAAREYLTAV